MSRARDWTDPETGTVYWFDVYSPATVWQLELLADAEGVELDDLLEANLSGSQVHERLNLVCGNVPLEIVARKRERREQLYKAPTCAICSRRGWECEGRITRHHFVPRWIMLELADYLLYSPRSFCTIYVCAGRHRELHIRDKTRLPKTIVPYLTDDEKALASHLLQCLKDERPVLYDLIAHGDSSTYEGQLVRDWRRGGFEKSSAPSGVESAVSGGVE